ncbi:MAG: CDP-diacylglycerol--glycerol-3-phosphate 3-phosphatidyltransferase [Rhodobacterales bacterium]|nr:MAG: CDP-diacylglycerol--glycerol-3-phosphate 3-phosphatidyltransferase [Rhodobacterales bacterium]
MTWTLPNILTVIRLLAAPMVAGVFVILPRGPADWAALVLFVLAAATDWLDGRIARRWGLESRFGAMLDPIADKAMVVIALALVMALGGINGAILIPAALILFREVFVSGLREFLGDTAGLLKVTQLAKWKTTVQMVAITLLLAKGGFEAEMIARQVGMDPSLAAGIVSGQIADGAGLVWAEQGWSIARGVGLLCLWLAAALTLITGWDYFRKALPYLKED